MVEKHPNARRYSPSLLVASFLVHAAGPSSYKELLNRNILSLPSCKTLRKLSAPWKVEAAEFDETYFTIRTRQLSAFEQHCILIIDEIYVSRKLRMCSGQIAGIAFDNAAVANTILCFMVKSVSCKYKDVVALFPISCISGEKNFDIFNNLISYLERLGIKIDGVCTDNHSANRSFFKLLCGSPCIRPSIQHPLCERRKLFLIFDSVHNFKNIYNNFLRLQSFDIPYLPCQENKEAKSAK